MDYILCGNEECRKKSNYTCSRCKLVKYCSKECQVFHWDNHKKECGKMNKLVKLGINQEESEIIVGKIKKKEIISQLLEENKKNNDTSKNKKVMVVNWNKELDDFTEIPFLTTKSKFELLPEMVSYFEENENAHKNFERTYNSFKDGVLFYINIVISKDDNRSITYFAVLEYVKK